MEVRAVIYNPYIVIPLATWAVAQITKFALAAMKGRLDLRYLYASGGMPSVHSAVVCSLATTALLMDGPGGAAFGITATLAAIVMYDSFGVRRSSGEQAAAINMLIMSLEQDKVKIAKPALRLREILGHQPSEVVVGAIYGVVLAALFNYDRIQPVTSFLQTMPGMREFWAYLAVFVVVLVGGVIQRLVLRAKYPKSRIMRQVARRVFTATQIAGWLGLVCALVEYEHVSYLVWRLWPMLVLAGLVLWAGEYWKRSYKAVPTELATEANEARKLKWLNFGRRRKAKR